MNSVYLSDNLEILKQIPDESIDLIYIDPPFNTGNVQKRKTIKTILDTKGDRLGFSGKLFKTVTVAEAELYQYKDKYENFIEDFLKPRLQESYRILKKTGSIYIHIDYREVHYLKILMDQIFGRKNFLNELIWCYDYGAKQKKKWPTKHDNILWYSKNPEHYYFDIERCDRIPYMAPKLAGKEKAERGKLPCDWQFITIVSPTGKEKTGYPTQKPLKLLERLVKTSCPDGGVVLDFFAGSGSTGHAALNCNKTFILVDENSDAIKVMKKRFENYYPNTKIDYY
jgi:site-specific DNA-methyltransferase (adenine-specific)